MIAGYQVPRIRPTFISIHTIYGTARLSAHPPVAVPLISYHMLCFAKKRVSAEYILDLVPFRVMVAVMLQVP